MYIKTNVVCLNIELMNCICIDELYMYIPHMCFVYTGSKGQAWRPEAQDVREHGADCLETETECGEGCQ